MLDFYIILDLEKKPIPDSIDHLIFAGSLELDLFERLAKKEIFDSKFTYYKDFRWSNKLLQKIYSKADFYKTDSDVKKLILIIEKALLQNSGLIAISD